MRRESSTWWTGSIVAAALAIATPATASTPDECRWEGEEIVCPPPVLEELRRSYLDLEERLAVSEAARTRCEREVAILEAARPQEAEASAWRPLAALPVLALAAGGGACLAAEGCPAAAGWTGIVLAVLTSIVGGLR